MQRLIFPNKLGIPHKLLILTRFKGSFKPVNIAEQQQLTALKARRECINPKSPREDVCHIARPPPFLEIVNKNVQVCTPPIIPTCIAPPPEKEKSQFFKKLINMIIRLTILYYIYKGLEATGVFGPCRESAKIAKYLKMLTDSLKSKPPPPPKKPEPLVPKEPCCEECCLPPQDEVIIYASDIMDMSRFVYFAKSTWNSFVALVFNLLFGKIINALYGPKPCLEPIECLLEPKEGDPEEKPKRVLPDV